MRFHLNRGCGPDGRAFVAMTGFPFGDPDEAIRFHVGGRGGGGGGWGGHRGGRRRRMFSSEEFQLIILKLIADEPRHGYAIIKALEELTHGDYAPSAGILYTNLELLEDMGMIERQASAGAKKSFAITDEGRAHLDARAEEVAALFERLEASGEGRRRSNRPELVRALGNLMTALGNRAARGGWNEALINEVVDILDEAAKRIERAK
ncbi:PadR family transcriptional regulator [Sphingomonas sp. LHG3406-1]|uniref:PadR family transcriptional regulator n=1 Tax=Sphingomonas sp. LHG3406-1 TaxID=2804617 RepID=UPI002601AB73|nr:PadR family transcriptional regulator [Sphingomonas sp. LHG3406-1]